MDKLNKAIAKIMKNYPPPMKLRTSGLSRVGRLNSPTRFGWADRACCASAQAGPGAKESEAASQQLSERQQFPPESLSGRSLGAHGGSKTNGILGLSLGFKMAILRSVEVAVKNVDACTGLIHCRGGLVSLPCDRPVRGTTPASRKT